MNTHRCEKTNLDYLKVNNNSQISIFIMHGYGASMNDLFGLWNYLDKNKDYNWYFPNGPIAVDLGGHIEGRAWFPINMLELQEAMMSGNFREFADKKPEGMESSYKVLEDFINIHATESIVIGGFSQGAMMSSHLAGAFKERLKGLMIFSGTLINEDKLSERLESLSHLRFFQSHGRADQLLEYRQGMNLFELLKIHRNEGEFVSFDGGHEIPMDVLSKARNYLSSLF